MAYVSQEEMKEIAPVVKAILKEYGLKGTLSIQHHSTLVVKIKDTVGMFADKMDDFSKKWGLDINEYWIEEHYGKGTVRSEMLNRVHAAMKGENWFCKDDIQSDYFHRKHYVDMKVVGG